MYYIYNMKTAIIQTRIDSELKKSAEAVLESIGIDMTSAIRLFLTQVVNQEKLPFKAVAKERYNAETLAACQEALDIESGKIPAKRYDNVKDLMKDILEVAENNSEYHA